MTNNSGVSKTTLRLVTSAILIGLGTGLSMVKIFALPFGGSVTLCSMVPLLIVGYMYGVKWGMFSGLVYGVLQMVLGATMSGAFAGLTGWSLIFMALLDYLVAYIALGTSGMFKNSIKNDTVAIALGSAIAIILRLLCHFLSGWILWGSYASEYFEGMNNSFGNFFLSSFQGQLLAAVYSLVYNATYIIPELIISVVALIIIMTIKPLREIITQKKESTHK